MIDEREDTLQVEITGLESVFLRGMLSKFEVDLRARKNPPKGWTYGRVQDALAHVKSLLAKLR